MNAFRSRFADPDAPLVRAAICGSVDSGKSTLLGRMVLDAGLVFDDERPEGGAFDLALLADGLEAEAEQGITIDVAYRHFATAERTYLFADAPGHLQYTRNMATAASLAEVAILVVDATEGLTEQTQRHFAICAAMGVRTVIGAINKMDACAFSETRFGELAAALADRAALLGAPTPICVPIAAADGDNVTARSSRTPWYAGPTLTEALDAAPAGASRTAEPLRLPVRTILRAPDGDRWVAGTVASGTIAVDQPIGIAGRPLVHGALRVTDLADARGEAGVAGPGTAVRLRVDGHVDLARGDVLVDPADVENGLASAVQARMVWLHDLPLDPATRFVVRAGTRWMFGRVTEVERVLDLATLQPEAPRAIGANDIADVRIEFAQPMPLDTFAECRDTGALVVVDPATSETVAAAMVTAKTPARRSALREETAIDRTARAAINGHRGLVAWFTGLSGAGKSTVTRRVEAALHERGVRTFLLDGDNLRLGLCGDLDFSPDGRTENIRRAAEVARLMLDAGIVVLCEFVSPMAIDRREARRIVGADDFVEVFVHARLETCIERDPKGLYRRALAGEIADFTGIGSPYEPPAHPELLLDTETHSIDANVEAAVDAIIQRTGVGTGRI